MYVKGLSSLSVLQGQLNPESLSNQVPNMWVHFSIMPFRVDRQLSGIETKYHLPCRWDESHTEYARMKTLLSREKRDHVAEAMWAASSRRQFLLKLKSKYAGVNPDVECMQAIT